MCVHMYIPLQISNYTFEDVNHLASSLGMSFGNYRVFIKYCVFSKILIYIPVSVFSRCQYVYTRQAGRTPALQQNWQSSEKSHNFKEKHNI